MFNSLMRAFWYLQIQHYCMILFQSLLSISMDLSQHGLLLTPPPVPPSFSGMNIYAGPAQSWLYNYSNQNTVHCVSE